MCSQNLLVDLNRAIKKNDIETIQSLLKDHKDVNLHGGSDSFYTNSRVCSPLWVAIRYGREEIVELLVNLGADVNERFFDSGYSFFHLMAYLNDSWEDDKQIAEVLIKHGANVDVSCGDVNLRTPLQIAIEKGNVGFAEFLIQKGVKLEGPEWNRQRPMNFVLKTPEDKQKEMLELLTKYGMNTGFQDEQGFDFTFFHHIAFLDNTGENNKEIAEILISNGADVNAPCNSTGKTALQIAIVKGNVKYAKFLLDKGARLSEGPEWDQEVPMKYVLDAPKSNQKEMLELLIHYGMDTKLRNKEGDDYLMMSNERAVDNPDKIDVLEIAKVLLDSGLPVSNVDKHGQTAIFPAIDAENVELVLFLVERGFDINTRSNDGILPLFCAAQKNNDYLVNFFLLNGAEINAKTNDGATTLHMACYKQNNQMIDLLIKKGAAISVEDKNGFTPFCLLRPHEYNEPHISSINAMVKEIAKLKFSDDSTKVKALDLDLVHGHPAMAELFHSCMKEISEMSNIKFYGCYTYCSVMKISKCNIKKLAFLTRNQDFITKFKAHLHKFPNYNTDLLGILEEAIRIKDKLLIVESRLKSVFHNSLPDIIIRNLSNNLTLDELPLDQN